MINNEQTRQLCLAILEMDNGQTPTGELANKAAKQLGITLEAEDRALLLYDFFAEYYPPSD